MRPTQLISARI